MNVPCGIGREDIQIRISIFRNNLKCSILSKKLYMNELYSVLGLILKIWNL